MTSVRCFFLEPTDQVEMSLRRLVTGTRCELTRTKCHDASVKIGREHQTAVPDSHGDHWPHSDPRWPQECACGYKFGPDDHWQFNPDTLYRRSDNGELIRLQDAPAGAMWNAFWMREHKSYKQLPDGVTLMVRLPDGCDWCVDGPSYNGGVAGAGWERTGVLPDVTAKPSILTPGYHGFLTDGCLVSC